jgi:hypothetical protein
MSKRKPGERDPAREKEHESDWERGPPEWTPQGRPPGEQPPGQGQPAKKGDDAGAGPAKLGDPPLEEPFGERSRHGGSGGRLADEE